MSLSTYTRFLDGAMKYRVSLLAFCAASSVLALLAYASYRTTQWGGSWALPQTEYELTFVDSKGNPLEDIELRVEDRQGNQFFWFPVTDFVPGQTPRSDNDGVLRFHHVPTGVEWDNYGWSLFWCFGIQRTRSPEYVCRFLRAGKEVHRVRYTDLPDWDEPGETWDQVPKVKRRWNWSVMRLDLITWNAEETDDANYSRLHSLFQRDGTKPPSREVQVACRNALRLSESKQNFEDIDFPVARRTITVKGQDRR